MRDCPTVTLETTGFSSIFDVINQWRQTDDASLHMIIRTLHTQRTSIDKKVNQHHWNSFQDFLLPKTNQDIRVTRPITPSEGKEEPSSKDSYDVLLLLSSYRLAHFMPSDSSSIVGECSSGMGKMIPPEHSSHSFRRR
ncbi:hypothetical protein CEXT_768931 [Caerostris extrusa]|uniref:Uncharacterized protein n=1 Tax=Caerostris extrusa TaxID=172846 RepID=A0AAV4V5I3_CAEEX|nr:hypothetical protein CEXT_768931 [Caerostris extrusa]